MSRLDPYWIGLYHDHRARTAQAEDALAVTPRWRLLRRARLRDQIRASNALAFHCGWRAVGGAR